jgi:hypothetical protein
MRISLARKFYYVLGQPRISVYLKKSDVVYWPRVREDFFFHIKKQRLFLIINFLDCSFSVSGKGLCVCIQEGDYYDPYKQSIYFEIPMSIADCKRLGIEIDED